jgi:hypothetical protein
MVSLRLIRIPSVTLALAVIVPGLTACSDRLPSGLADDPPDPFPTVAIVSNPVAAPAASGLSLGGAATGGVVYLSLPPGSVPGGTGATLVNRATGAVMSVTMRDGGFDPVPVGASAGDTLDLRVTMGGLALGGTESAETVDLVMVVPERRPPVIVRTDPPPRRPDVPLNATLLVVFSEPLDPASVSTATVRLLLNGSPVPGSVALVDELRLRAVFTPDAPLQPGTDYVLSISQGILDLDGDAMPDSYSAAFTTADGALAAVVHVSADPAAPPVGSAVVSTLAAAMSRVEAGGHVLVYDGTYPAADVIVDRPVTFATAPGAKPLIEVTDPDAEGWFNGFRVEVNAGTVVFRNLAFAVRGPAHSGIYAFALDQLVVEGCSFSLEADVMAGVTASTGNSPGSHATVRASSFRGGMTGVFAASPTVDPPASPGRVEVLESDFADHSWSAIQFQGMGTGRVEGNTITECGVQGCIRSIAGARVDIVGNHLATTAERQTGYQGNAPGVVRRAILLSGSTAAGAIASNIIEGWGGSLAFPEGAIQVGSGAQATVHGNVVTSVVLGITVYSGGVIQGSDNRLESVGTAWSNAGGILVDQYSDAVNYLTAAVGAAVGSVDVRCNWWGSTAGPGTVPDSGTLLFTPWSNQPVAGTGDRSCVP